MVGVDLHPDRDETLRAGRALPKGPWQAAFTLYAGEGEGRMATTGEGAGETPGSRFKAEPRNLVVCCDGTSNEIGVLTSNVLKLYRIAEKSERQLAYYHPGVGTVAMPNSWGRWRQKARSVFEMATGHGIDRDVLAAYCFVCRHYRPGDRIFLFGFSRGAYTARVLAGMIHVVGLLREDQINFAGYALKAYKAASQAGSLDVAHTFQRLVNSDHVPIHFMGLWDTVASVIVPGPNPLSRFRLEDLPCTTRNPAVRVFRHAIAMDEFRRMFRVTKWVEPQKFKPNPFSREEVVPDQDSRQVWFAGCHSDVGGGFVEKQSALSKFPLIWMLEQARDHGLLIRTSMVNHIVLGRKREGARRYTRPDPAGSLHKSLTWWWRPLEILPKSVRYRDWPRRWALLGYYLPWAEPRHIPEGSRIHVSAIDRRGRVEAYRPVNLPERYEIEPMPSPIDDEPGPGAGRDGGGDAP
jgi:uncharacterized protein (DUF2235 family)